MPGGDRTGPLGYNPPSRVNAITREQDLTELKDHAEYLENELKEIRNWIQEIGE